MTQNADALGAEVAASITSADDKATRAFTDGGGALDCCCLDDPFPSSHRSRVRIAVRRARRLVGWSTTSVLVVLDDEVIIVRTVVSSIR